MLHKCIIKKDKTAWSITSLITYVIYIVIKKIWLLIIMQICKIYS